MPRKNDIPIKLTVDSSDLQKLDDLARNVPDQITTKINVDDSEVSTAFTTLNQLEDDASVKVNVDDGEITSTLLLYDDLAEDQSVTVSTEDTDVKQTLALLEQIRNLSIINVALNVPPQALDFIEKIPGVFDIFQQMGAANILEAATPVQLESGDQIISDLYTEGFGESREAVARFVAMLANIGVEEKNITDVATDLYEAQAAITAITGSEPDMVQLLARAEDLKNLNLADSWESATDVIVAGFQSSIGISGDFLGDLGEFAPTFAALNFTSEQMLNTLSTGLSGGVDNISRMSEGIISFNELASGMDENFTKALDTIDSKTGSDLADKMDLFQAGDLSGADFMSSVLDAARDYADTEGKVEAQAILSSLFGSTAENIGVDALLAIDPNSEGISNIEDRAQQAADTVRDTWGTALEELQRTIEEGVAQTLDETFDLKTRLETAKGQFQTFVTELQSGTGVGDAIEIAFGLEGADTFVANIERMFGNFSIILLQAVAVVQQIQGLDNAATLAEVARLSEQQLTFDLQVANPDEIGQLLSTAAARGVDVTGLGEAINTALTETFAEGDYLEGINILEGLEQAAIEKGASPEAARELMQQYQDELSAAFDASFEAGDYDVAKKIAETQNDPTKYTDALRKKFGFDAADFDAMIADSMQALTDQIATESWWDNIIPSDTTVTALDDAKTSITDLSTTTEEAMTNAALVTSLASDEMILLLQAIEDGFISAEEKAALMDAGIEESLIGNTVTASFDAVALSASTNFPIVIGFLDETTQSVQQLDAAADGLQSVAGILASLSTAVDDFDLGKLQAIQTAANGGVPGGGGGGDTTINQNINQTNNVSNGAQATATTYDIAAAVR